MSPRLAKARKIVLPCPTEHEEQCALFQWAALRVVRYPDLAWLYAIPNAGGYSGGFKSNVVRVKRMLAEGVKPGYPDIGLDVARGGFHGLRIEMKRQRQSHTSSVQLVWHLRLKEQGYYMAAAKGWEAAAAVLIEYLDGRIKVAA